MKKTFVIWISILTALILPACGAGAAYPDGGAAAVAGEVVLGDADGDGELTILDATHIQRYLAGYQTSVPEHLQAAMVYDGRELSIIDATMIQRRLAGLTDHFPVEVAAPTERATEQAAQQSEEPVLRIDANGYTFLADFEDNSSAEALISRLAESPVTIVMRDYGGFEKVGDLPFALPRNDTRITTAPGDVILYQGDQLTIYYDTNTWSFTRVAAIRGADSSLRTKLGEGGLTVTLSLGYPKD